MILRLSARDMAMLVIGLLFLIFAALIGLADRSLFGTLAILPMMTICTAAARGYEARQMGRFAGCGMAMVASGVLVALMALHPVAGDALAVFIAVIFAGVALRRSMLLFQLPELQRRRRRAALLIVIAALFFTGWAMAYSDYDTSRYDNQILRGVKELASYQLSYRQHSAGRRFAPLTPAEIIARWNDDFATLHHRDDQTRVTVASIDTSYAQGADHFVIRIKPRGELPFFPYNLLTSWPVYRADDSGRIRSERVQTDRWCSDDAPVIARVGDLRWLLAHDKEAGEHALDLLQQLEGEPAFSEVLRSGTPAARSAAIRVAYNSKSPHSIEIILAALRDRDAAVRKEAAFYLGLRRDPRTVPALMTALQDPVDDVMFAAASALGRIRDPKTLDLLAPMLANTALPEKVRYQVAVVIGEVGGDAAATLLIPALSDRSPLIKKSVLVGLGYSKSVDALDPLLKASAIDDIELRDTAAFALGQLKNPAARPRLREMAKSDPSVRVRQTAALYAED